MFCTMFTMNCNVSYDSGTRAATSVCYRFSRQSTYHNSYSAWDCVHDFGYIVLHVCLTKNYHRPCLEFQDYRNPCFLEIGAFYMGTFPLSLSSENILSNYELFSKTGVQRYKEKIPTNHIMLAMNWSSDVLDQLEPYDFLHKFGSPCFYESSPSIFDQVINRRRKEKVE